MSPMESVRCGRKAEGVTPQPMLPCVADIRVYAGLARPCDVCAKLVPDFRSKFGWARQMRSDYYLSDCLTAEQREMLVKEISKRWKAERAARKDRKPGLKEFPPSLRLELHKIQRSLLAAQSTALGSKFDGALVDAQSRLQAVINLVEEGSAKP